MSDHRNISREELASVAHDVRQMLAVITGRAGLLRHGADPKTMDKNLAAIETAAIQAGAVLSRLYPSARGESPANTDILQTLRQSAALMQPKPGISWQRGDQSQGPKTGVWFLEENVAEGCFTTAAPWVLLEVLNNLLLNSLEVMPDGGLLQADLEQVGQHWRLRLRDSGPGISPGQREKIFESGFGSSGDPDRGIGLSSCRDLLSCHGGSLQLGAAGQSGACFELLLPYTHANSCRPAEQTTVTGVEYCPTVLVVDDDRAVREMLNDVLMELGCRVKVARDAPGAAEIFPTECFEMVILDQSLPGISGLEIAEDLRKQDPNLILVLISGWGRKEVLDKARSTVVDFVAEKPITVKVIKGLLNEAGALCRRRLENS